MNGRTHLITGIATGTMLSHQMNMPLWMGAIAGGFGALLPDIDHPQSLISSFIPFGFVLSWFTGAHRGVTHSIISVFTFSVMAYATYEFDMLPLVFALAFIAGYVVHLVGDMFTPMGVPLVFPIPWYFRALPKFVLNWTAFIFEAVALVGSLIVIGYIVWKGF